MQRQRPTRRDARNHGERPWSEVVDRHGHWIRDVILHPAAQPMGYGRAEVYRVTTGLKYPGGGASSEAVLPESASEKSVD